MGHQARMFPHVSLGRCFGDALPEGGSGFSGGVGISWFPTGGVDGIDGSGWGEEHLHLPVQAVGPMTRTRISGRKHTGEYE